MKHFKLVLRTCISFAVAVTIIFSTPTYADSSSREATLDFFNANGIYYYNPTGRSNSCASSTLGGSNTNYASVQVFSDAEIAAIEANRPFYESAAAKYNFDWKIIAAIHSMEHNLSRDNPANGQGAYQLYSYTNGGKNSNAFYPAGPIFDAEFQRQTDIAAEVIYKKSSGLNLNSSNGVKALFFRYNGTSSDYITKATNMGFSLLEAQNGEGSPYVMNRYDAMRDPTSPNVSRYWVGKYTSDGNYVANASMGTRFGAFVKYLALGGDTYDSAFCYYDTGLVAGESGMNLNQATQFMNTYKSRVIGHNSSSLIALYGMTSNSCAGGIAYNCVSFSRYFVNTYTSHANNRITAPLGDGKDIVGNLTSGGYDFTFGTTPRAYAIFSTGKTSSYGHTGVVLGINTDTNTIIIGEAACGSGEGGVKAKEEPLSEYTNGDYTFAYPSQLIGV